MTFNSLGARRIKHFNLALIVCHFISNTHTLQHMPAIRDPAPAALGANTLSPGPAS